MRKQISIFIVTLLFFAAGTSAISYSLASESYNNAKPKSPAYKIIKTAPIPWYCAPNIAKIKAQLVEPNRSGYYTSGYNPKPAYQAIPGYQPAQPSILPTPAPIKIVEMISMPAKLQPNDFTRDWQTNLSTCPAGHTMDESLIIKKCSIALQKKLDGNPLPAESKQQYETCAQVIAPSVWNAKISQKICSAFYLYENDCAASQTAKRACVPLSKYLTTAGVERVSIPKTQSDTIYLCKNVYPKP